MTELIDRTRITGNQYLVLDNPNQVAQVTSGIVYIYRINIDNLARDFLFELQVGHIAIGMVSSDYSIMLVGVPEAFINITDFDTFLDTHDNPLELINNWLISMTSELIPRLPPQRYLTPSVGEEIRLRAGDIIRSTENVLWIIVVDGELHIADLKEDTVGKGDTCLIANSIWLTATESTIIVAQRSDQLTTVIPDLSIINRSILQLLVQQAEASQLAEQKRLKKRQENDQVQVRNALLRLGAPLSQHRTPILTSVAENPVLTALQRIGLHLEVSIVEPFIAYYPQEQQRYLNSLLHQSRLNMRRVALRDEWWTTDSGVMLGFLRETREPVALIPNVQQGYTIYPFQKQSQIITEKVSTTLDDFALVFYRSLPDTSLGGLDLLKFASQGIRPDIFRLLIMSLIGAILTLLTPIIIGQVFSSIIPRGDVNNLSILVLILTIVSASSAAISSIIYLLLLRIEARVDVQIQPALLARVLDLPVSFFRQYQTGDLGVRLMAFTRIRQEASSIVLGLVISTIFSSLNLLLLFAYAPRLALVVILILIVVITIVMWLTRLQVRYEYKLANLQGQLAGQLLGFLTSITKLRVAGAENRAFTAWAQDYSRQHYYSIQAGAINNIINSIVITLPPTILLVIFGLVGTSNSALSVGAFAAFITALSQFLTNILTISQSGARLLRLIPQYDRARPILETEPEVDTTSLDPGELRGDIEIVDVSFRYRSEAPMVLEHISLSIRSGEFVALVGTSGSGKSTLLRLLLGFDTPTQGTVYYDRKDLQMLDMRTVRNQIGVVPQDGRLLDGSLLQNIIGSGEYTIDDAWAIAKLVGLDDDIQAMPMGMHTIVTNDGRTLSGGQRQRLLIARALIQRPRIVFLDEATSALDNQTQSIVMDSLMALDATRIVIAHRLSTIIRADKIYVLQDGRIIENGTYTSLMKQDGAFKKLAKRQLI